MRKLKVLMISMDTGALKPGAEPLERMRLYASVLDRLDVIVLATAGLPQKTGNMSIYPTSLNKIASFFKALWLGGKLLRRESFDIISSQDPFGAGLIAYLLKLYSGVWLQLQIHTGLFTPYFWAESGKNRAYVTLAKILLPRADCIKVVSHGIRQYLIDRLGINPSKISVLPVYTSFEHFEKGDVKTDLHKRYPQFDFIILMASRLVKQKNISLAIEAVGMLADRYPRLGLVIVGSGPDENRLKNLAEGLNLEDRVKFESWTDNMVSYYKSSDLFLLTSNYEGWARTILEAMACGLPAIMTGIYIGVTSEAIESGRNGIVTPVGDVAAVASVIGELYNDPEKRKRMSSEAAKTIKELEFRDKDRYLELYLESFKPCCEGL